MGSENNFNYSSTGSPDARPGPFLATVIGHQDPTYMGTIEVELLRPTGNTSDETSIHQVKYMSPFYGVTSASHLGENNDFSSTQKSYGWWAVPPDVGTTVIVIFIDGDARRGFWIGCVQDEGMNFMVPGLAATQKVVGDAEADNAGSYGRVPVAEYNKKINDLKDPDVTQLEKPKHPLADVLDSQGLLFDDIRGITTSSARREVPSMVFGISTPGPIDKRDGAPRGRIGKKEWKIDNAFVGRLGGSTWVMDDGDARFLRKKTASMGPPEYASLEDGETDGDVEIPHNELIRLRTRTGHQILLHNSEDLIYITNARGTAWIELTSDGKIDIFAQDSISIKTDKDLNLYSGRDINIEAKRNFNVKVHEEMHTHVVKDHILIVDENQKIHVKMDVDKTYDQKYTHHVKQDVNMLFDSAYQHKVVGNFDFNIGGHNFQTSGGNMEVKAANTTISGGNINLNGPTATTASEASEAVLPQRLKLHKLSIETGEYDEAKLPPTIMRRVITTEPYVYHENVDPVKVKSAETDRDIDGRYEDTDEEQTAEQSDFSETMLEPPELWKTYSTATDTFKTIPPQAPPEEQQ
jgi:phage baseplate assembly protein gpV